jgi:hypothetical protein
MENKKNREFITAYVDNELKNKEELNAFKKELERDPSLEFDLNAESLTKKMLSDKLSVNKTPDHIKGKILKNISAESAASKNKNLFVSKIYSQRFITYSTVGIILLALILLLINRPDQTNGNISEQTGNNNMLVMARAYFEDFLVGKNNPQFNSNNPDEIKNFFKLQGVKYDIFIPAYNNYSLEGVSVLEHHGEKFAHQIYSDKNGNFIYIFQVHENYFKGDSIIRLTEDLMDYLRKGNKYISRQKNYIAVLKKKNENVLALVSNSPDADLPDNF